jgi:mannitol/fructose-specific phosphotransferase system IIA component (Ntr-type)
MELRQLFAPADLLVDFEPADKWDAIKRLLQHLVDESRIASTSAPSVLEQVLARERSMSTGMERGIAIPHAAVDGLERVVAGLGVVQGPTGDGVPFDSVDAGPAWLVVLLLIPRPQKLLHIRTLADLARHLGNEEVRQALRNARSPEEAWKALARA